jgi:hypothetical protein
MSKTLSNQIHDPLCGISGRANTLKQLHFSANDFLKGCKIEDEQHVHSEDEDIIVYPDPNNCAKKCVYQYDDKFIFQRLLNFDSLIFDSHFESGNLHSAYRLVPKTFSYNYNSPVQFYNLYLQEDLNCASHYAQWFLFSVTNMSANQKATMTLLLT